MGRRAIRRKTLDHAESRSERAGRALAYILANVGAVRWQGRGPQYLKIGGRVVYRLSDIEAFEAASLHANTVGPLDETADKGAGDNVR